MANVRAENAGRARRAWEHGGALTMNAGVKVPRVALIGISGYGRIHLQLARECRDRGEIAIAAATVINPGEEAANVAELEAHGTKIYADYAEMLRAEAGRIDLCLIPTGIHWHARMTIAALRAGANVLVEKPLAGSRAEIDAVQREERAAGRFVAVGFQDLYEPGTNWLKAELLKGTIGEIESVRFLGIWPRNRSYFTRNDWAGRTHVDGVAVLDSPLNNAFGHFVMLSLYFASPQAQGAAAAELEAVDGQATVATATPSAERRPRRDRKSTRLNSSHRALSRMPSSA